MKAGHVRDNFPRLLLSLPGLENVLAVEFIIDTGFDGELALPAALATQLEILSASNRPVRLADGTLRHRPYYELLLDWEEEPRRTEVLVIEGNPLLGVELLSGSLLQIEVVDGGEVSIEPL